jgi:DNA-binding HxlR family transcriptional regulator
MKKRTSIKRNTKADSCAPSEAELSSFRRAVHTIVGKWKIDILWSLLSGPQRFGELRRAMPGITQHMLTAQLRALEADGLVVRTAYAEIPPRVDYALTPKAMALEPVFLALVDWARANPA